MIHRTKILRWKECKLLIMILSDSYNLLLKLTRMVFILFIILKMLMTQQYNIMYSQYRNLALK
jgi:hypothetical protein